MPNYLVRLRDGHWIVGIFGVEDVDDLEFWVDEVCDPALCEWVEIGSGSVIYPHGGAMAVPAPDHEWDDDQVPVLTALGEYDIGGLWLNALFADSLDFTPFAEPWEVGANDN
ncbi:MAG: hypothetical protein AB1942_12220 [Pseudomonadota bacterium]